MGTQNTTIMMISMFILQAEVWLRYAECLYMINKLEDAAEAYEKVISLAPNHKIAKLNLSIILQRLGKFDGALESLDQSKTRLVNILVIGFIN